MSTQSVFIHIRHSNPLMFNNILCLSSFISLLESKRCNSDTSIKKQQLHSLDIIAKSAVTIYTKTCLLLVMRNSALTLTLWICSLEMTINDRNSIGFKLAICWQILHLLQVLMSQLLSFEVHHKETLKQLLTSCISCKRYLTYLQSSNCSY